MADTVVSTITVQNGGRTYDIQLEHPRDATDEQISAYAQQQVKSQFPETAYPSPQIQRPKPESFAQGFAEGAAIPFNNIARLVETGADALGISQPISNVGRSLGMAGTVAEAEAAQNAMSQASPYQGSAAGRFAGEVAGTLPTAALPGGVFAQGAAGGALLTNKRDAIGIGMDALLGGAGGVAGNAVLRGAARLANPTVAPELRTLMDAGVTSITPGQVARAGGDSFANRVTSAVEDRATSIPITGDMIMANRRAGLQQFERATVNRALEPIGMSLPDNIPNGRRAIVYAGDQLSQAYDNTTARIGRFSTDQQFVDDLAGIEDQVAEMLPERATQFRNILRGVGRFFSDDGTSLDGYALNQIDRRLSERIRKYAVGDADQQQIAEGLELARDAIANLAGRANPEVAGELSSLRQGWKSLTQVERASGNSKAAITPAGYSQAVKQSSDTVRRRGYARGNALNQDLSDAASQVLPPEIPDSGTAGRLFNANLLGLAAGAATAPVYAAARAATPVLTRQSYLSPQMAALLEYGARGAPVAAPALIEQLRQ